MTTPTNLNLTILKPSHCTWLQGHFTFNLCRVQTLSTKAELTFICIFQCTRPCRQWTITNTCQWHSCKILLNPLGQDSTHNPRQAGSFGNKFVQFFCNQNVYIVWIQLTLLYVTLIRLWACPRNTVYVEQDSTHNPSQAGSFVNTFVQWMGRKAMQHTKRILSTKEILQNVPQCVNGLTLISTFLPIRNLIVV